MTDHRTQTFEYIPLDRLLLDSRNPRLGNQGGSERQQSDTMQLITKEFGIEDVLASIAVNGYFEAEPLIGIKRNDDKITVIEGNRRLAACLILSGDDRAKAFPYLTEKYQKVQARYGKQPLRSVPVLVHREEDYATELLPYLGVRHIAAPQPWDSYAKAVWVAKVIDAGDVTIEQVAEMIGDHHKTIERMLEGYYFTQQLVETSQFNPRDSMRLGRGSNTDYPFSWVYTALGFKAIRNWLDLGDRTDGVKKLPIKREHLEDASDLMTFMLGEKSSNTKPVISDSREISRLARAVSEPEMREQLKKGKTLTEVEELMKPARDRVLSSLLDAENALDEVMKPLSKEEVSQDEVGPLVDPARRVEKLARNVNHFIGRLDRGESRDEPN